MNNVCPQLCMSLDFSLYMGRVMYNVEQASVCRRCIRRPGLPPEPYIRLSYPINALFYVESVKFSP